MSREERFEALGQPQKRGQATEALLKAEFLLRDVPVLTPEYDNEPYDFVVELDGSFHRVQAKTAYRATDGTVCFETVSTRAKSDGYERDGYEGRADVFAVYNPVLDEKYVVDVEEAASGKTQLRFVEPANGQEAGINWHEDFLLDDWIAERQ